MADTTTLIDGLYFGEGPRWRDGRLWFSDFYDHQVKSVDEQGELRIEVELDDQPSGLGWMPDGTLLVVAMKARKLMRLENGQLVEHADLRDLTAHLCNDMVVDARGNAYVGNFGFDLDAEFKARGVDVILDHPTTNLVRVDAEGRVSVAAPDMHFPNGTVITPDGATLIIAESLGGCLTAFDIGAGGELSNRRIWAPLEGVAPVVELRSEDISVSGRVAVAVALLDQRPEAVPLADVADEVDIPGKNPRQLDRQFGPLADLFDGFKQAAAD